MRRRYQRVLYIIVPLLITYILLHLLTPILYSTSFLSYLHVHRGIEYLLFPLLYVLSSVIFVLPDFPLSIIGLDLFGPQTTVILVYFLTLLSACIEFYIGKYYGEKIAKYVINRLRFTKLFEYLKDLQAKDLLLLRLFAGYFFDPISYLAGIARIPFTTFFLITAIASLPYFIAFYLFSSHVMDLGKVYIFNQLLRYGLLVILIIIYWLRSRKQNKN